ncbi:MAG TPA: contact-dependent growth inhibition system immunity protein [Rubricoccaceae bacterium]
MGKSLQQIEGYRIDVSEHDSGVIRHTARLWPKPVSDYTAGDLRFMIGQKHGLHHLIPRALSFLEQNPLVEDDEYGGELLRPVMRVPEAYWQEHPDHLSRAVEAARRALAELEHRKEKRAARPAFLPGEDPSGRDPIEEDLIKAIRPFLPDHRAG